MTSLIEYTNMVSVYISRYLRKTYNNTTIRISLYIDPFQTGGPCAHLPFEYFKTCFDMVLKSKLMKCIKYTHTMCLTTKYNRYISNIDSMCDHAYNVQNRMDPIHEVKIHIIKNRVILCHTRKKLTSPTSNAENVKLIINPHTVEFREEWVFTYLGTRYIFTKYASGTTKRNAIASNPVFFIQIQHDIDSRTVSNNSVIVNCMLRRAIDLLGVHDCWFDTVTHGIPLFHEKYYNDRLIGS